jgi:tetratricopeptide (TPR) repeat protein
VARHTKSKDTNRGPDPAQLRAVERLLIDERFDEALERSERLVGLFPQHSGFRGLHIEAMLASGHADQAAHLARRWMEQHPNSVRAVRLSAIACLEAGLPNLAVAAAERLAMLGEPDTELEQDSRAGARDARSRMGDVDTATALRVEQGLLLCFVGQVAEADQLLAGIEVPLAHHALALTRFQHGDVEGAWATIRPALDGPAPFPASLFTAALYSLYLGHLDRVGMLVERLNALLPTRPEHLFHQISGLLLLDRLDDAVKAFERAPAGLFKRDDDSGIVASLWNAAGAACARAGDWGKARGLFQQAVDADPEHLSAKTNLGAAQDREAGEAPVVLELQDWLPESSLRAAVEAIGEVIDQGFDPREDPELLDLDELPERSSYLAVMARQGDAAARSVAREVLKLRAEQGEAEAVDALRRLLLDAEGPDFERVRAASALYFAGELPRIGVVEMFLSGARRKLLVRVPWLQSDPALPGMDEGRYFEFYQAEQQRSAGNAREACRIFAGLLASAPTRAAELRLKHELAMTQLSADGLQREGESCLSELLSSPDCLLRTRAYQALRELNAGIENGAQQLVVDTDEDGPYAFEDATELLTVREELARRRGDGDRAMTVWVAHEALGAFEIAADGTRYEGRLEIPPDADLTTG